MENQNEQMILRDNEELLIGIKETVTEYFEVLKEIQKTNEEVVEQFKDYKDIVRENERLEKENKKLREENQMLYYELEDKRLENDDLEER